MTLFAKTHCGSSLTSWLIVDTLLISKLFTSFVPICSQFRLYICYIIFCLKAHPANRRYFHHITTLEALKQSVKTHLLKIAFNWLLIECICNMIGHLVVNWRLIILTIYWFVVIFRARIAFRKTVVGGWRFDYLSGSHLQSQVKSRRQMMVFMPVVLKPFTYINYIDILLVMLD